MPIEREWTDWLYQHRAPLPRWYVGVGRYIGREPFWYQPHDISIRELEPGSAPVPHSGDLIRDHGALATMVIGYLIVQAYGVAGEERLLTLRPAPTATSVPTTSHDVSTTPTLGNADSSANSKPSDTRSTSNLPPGSRSPISIADQPGLGVGSPTPVSRMCLVTIVTSQTMRRACLHAFGRSTAMLRGHRRALWTTADCGRMPIAS